MLTDRYLDAIRYVLIKHDDHIRKGSGVPYFSHLLSVSALVMEAGGDEDLCIAALLHDTVEDRGGMPVAHAIRRRFGDRVADVVLGCSDSTTTDGGAKEDWKTRKLRYIAHVRVASDDVRAVSCADKLHNARCIAADYDAIGDELWQRFTADRDSTLWYYESLVAAFGHGNPPPHARQLAGVVAALKASIAAK